MADFNSDGTSDLVTADFNSNTASVLLGNGNGTFQAKQSFGTGDSPASVTVGDFNSDGKSDLVTADHSGNTASVLLGNGNGTFQARQAFGAGSHPRSVAVADLNGDGKNDLVTADENDNTASVLLGNGTTTTTTTASGLQPITGVSLATQADALWLKARSTAIWIASTRFPGRSEPRSVAFKSPRTSHHPWPMFRRPPRLASPTPTWLRIRPPSSGIRSSSRRHRRSWPKQTSNPRWLSRCSADKGIGILPWSWPITSIANGG